MGESSDGASGVRKLGLSPEEIEKVKKEWEETQKKKQERETAKKEKESEKKDKDKEEGKESLKDTKPIASAPTPVARIPAHQRFVLHRDMFALRLSEHRKRRQAAQAKELAPRFPGAPLGGVI